MKESEYCISESTLEDIHNILTVQLEQAFDYRDNAEQLLDTTTNSRDIELLSIEIETYDELINKISNTNTNVEAHLHKCYNKYFE